MWINNSIGGIRPSANEWPNWGDMGNIMNYHTFKYGARMGFWWIYQYCINVHDWSYISCDTNETLGKSGWWTNYTTQTGNWQKPSVSNLPVLFCSCLIRKTTTYVDKKALDMHQQLQKGFCEIIVGIAKHKRVPHLCT